MKNTPRGERLHIGIFGKRNAGKSSLLNAITGQNLAVVSPVKGTTTDPVYKAMELLPIGPVVFIDTAGIDDYGEMGGLRTEKTRNILRKVAFALLVIDAQAGSSAEDAELIEIFKATGVKFLTVFNKEDIFSDDKNPDHMYVSAATGHNIDALKEKIARLAPAENEKLRIVGDLISPSDFVILVTPIDKAAPKGRLILPQQQTIRDILEADAVAIVVKEFELKETLQHLGRKPKLVITDSQVFAKASADTPPDIPLTSFSILMARYKGFLDTAVKGVKAAETLSDGDKVLICEGCTHHRQCDDIGTIKIPRWIRQYTGKNPDFSFTSGGEFPQNISMYKLVIHCGGCIQNEREMSYRQACAADLNIPFTNYGIIIAYMQGILKRSLSIFPHILAEIED